MVIREVRQTPTTQQQTNVQATTTQATLATPTVKAAVQAKGIKLTWNRISNATGYIVYRRLSGAKNWTKLATIDNASTVSYLDKSTKAGKGKWVKVKTIKSAKTVTYLDKKAKKGKKYTYKVKTYYGKSCSAAKTSKAIKR